MSGEERTSGHVFLWWYAFRLLAINIHILLPLLPSAFTLVLLAFTFLGEHGFQVFRSPVNVLGIVWVLERAGIMEIRQLLCQCLPRLH